MCIGPCNCVVAPALMAFPKARRRKPILNFTRRRRGWHFALCRGRFGALQRRGRKCRRLRTRRRSTCNGLRRIRPATWRISISAIPSETTHSFILPRAAISPAGATSLQATTTKSAPKPSRSSRSGVCKSTTNLCVSVSCVLQRDGLASGGSTISKLLGRAGRRLYLVAEGEERRRSQPGVH